MEEVTKMESFCSEILPFNRKKVIDELLRGCRFAGKLKDVLRETCCGGGGDARELITGIFDSFSNTLSMLNSPEFDEISQFLPSTQVGSPCLDGRKSEDSVQSSKSSTVKDRRGCYKRRRNSQSWTTERPALVDDGHGWRKYGQKVILNAKHPRNYYRCTHKYDQGCQATKQVQQLNEKPPLYRTTYIGHHTCKASPTPQIFLDSDVDASDSKTFLLSFSNDCKNGETSVSFFPSIKQEHDKEADLTHHHHSSSSNYLLSSDLSPFDHSVVNSSCTTSTATTTKTRSLDLDDMMVGSVYEFDDDVLQFPEFS
ncbi:hypothetical protein K2173_000094 [Erythroxylum novogranatense]|uniref:WRKY domain-containing protein n=1 Tax=Erythroxylum novogranatense TaxID=1862640 RepID=A0AAV8SPK3_9ROSI|nr:hypothetical protein K2173_000094 [Erythroxylum novogranatense]